jgi:glutathione S-transferase
MFYPFFTSIVTLAAAILYFYFIMRVGMVRGKLKIPGYVNELPLSLATAQRIQINTTEHLVLFLPLLWLCASLTTDQYSATIGAIWVLGRIIYAIGYTKDFSKRGVGFLINVIAYLFLIGGVIWGLYHYYIYMQDVIGQQPPLLPQE